MSTGQGQPSEAELRAAYEAEIKKVRVEHVLVENVVTLVNLGMRRTGLSPGTEDERELAQVRLAIESIRALLPLLEEAAPAQAGPVREALSQLQLAFVRIGGQQGSSPAPSEASSEPGPSDAGPGGSEEPQAERPSESGPSTPGEPGPAQRSGRLWVPGQ
jgi:hypothetical protein